MQAAPVAAVLTPDTLASIESAQYSSPGDADTVHGMSPMMNLEVGPPDAGEKRLDFETLISDLSARFA